MRRSYIREIYCCCTRGGHETAKVGLRSENRRGRGLRGGAGERVNGMSLGRPLSLRYQRRPVDATAAQDGG